MKKVLFQYYHCLLGQLQVLFSKYLALFVMNQWVRMKQKEKYGPLILKRMVIKDCHIRNELYRRNSCGVIKGNRGRSYYGIDMRADTLYLDVDIVFVDDILDEADAIVVTSATFFDEIEEKLVEKVSCPIVSLEDSLYEV